MNDTSLQTFQEEATIKLSLPSELGYEKLVRHTISWLANRLQLPSSRMADMQTAVSEACINAIEHGNQALSRLRVKVTLTVTAEYFEAVVADQAAAPFRPPAAPPATIQDKIAGVAPARGMGLMLIEGLVDECGFLAEEPGFGNRFRLRIYN